MHLWPPVGSSPSTACFYTRTHPYPVALLPISSGYFWAKPFPVQIPQHSQNLVILHTYPPMKMEQTECSETLAYKIQTPGNYPEESIQHTQNPTCITPVCNSQYDACTLQTSFWILCSVTHYTASKALLCSLILKWFLCLANHNVSMF